jgi:hypothetical protein
VLDLELGKDLIVIDLVAHAVIASILNIKIESVLVWVVCAS